MTFVTSKAQVLKGYVYDEESAVKRVSVINQTQKILALTDERGQFEINAMLFDSIAIISSFHEIVSFRVDSSSLSSVQTYHLKSSLNQLDEVIVTADSKKKFRLKKFNASIRQQILNDIKNNPGKYSVNSSQYGLDLVQLFGLISSLFKKKKTKESVVYAQPYDLDSLFNKSRFFNHNLLHSALGIKDEHEFLFFEYCTARGISSSLLDDRLQLELLDSLVIRSKEFKSIVQKSKKND
ncbi:peptidase associated/transthyretin-like domain-containing protein [Winogradskyella aurantiaca]|uniref:hypothetical protein n=1 Tax=Winogradskyella aurantiaca TaxID=2219558 RepID=UPI000E1DEACF|nr:hypothetical protein [Winogradskyella aurantiaca]